MLSWVAGGGRDGQVLASLVNIEDERRGAVVR
jgi:hypothetical protein